MNESTPSTPPTQPAPIDFASALARLSLPGATPDSVARDLGLSLGDLALAFESEDAAGTLHAVDRLHHLQRTMQLRRVHALALARLEAIIAAPLDEESDHRERETIRKACADLLRAGKLIGDGSLVEAVAPDRGAPHSPSPESAAHGGGPGGGSGGSTGGERRDPQLSRGIGVPPVPARSAEVGPSTTSTNDPLPAAAARGVERTPSLAAQPRDRRDACAVQDAPRRNACAEVVLPRLLTPRQRREWWAMGIPPELSSHPPVNVERSDANARPP